MATLYTSSQNPKACSDSARQTPASECQRRSWAHKRRGSGISSDPRWPVRYQGGRGDLRPTFPSTSTLGTSTTVGPYQWLLQSIPAVPEHDLIVAERRLQDSCGESEGERLLWVCRAVRPHTRRIHSIRATLHTRCEESRAPLESCTRLPYRRPRRSSERMVKTGVDISCERNLAVPGFELSTDPDVIRLDKSERAIRAPRYGTFFPNGLAE